MAALSVSSSPMPMPMLTRSRRTFHLTTATSKHVIITPRPCSINTSSSSSSSLPSSSSSTNNNNKIFEDPSTGIVCYRDENGEITCEGYDEGPRLHHNLFHYYNTPTPIRDVEIIQLLQRCCLQLTSEDDDAN